jgi:predicted dehydrogenase
MKACKDIGVGVVGLGMGARVLTVNRDPDSRLVVRGLCDRNRRLLAARQSDANGAYATTDYDALLARKDIDVIGIFTPDRMHCRQILRALDAGKHVMVTKPMVNTMEEAADVIRAVQHSGRKLLVAQTQRWRPAQMAAKKLLDSGRLGNPVFVQADYVHDMRPVLARTPWRRDAKEKIWLVGAACHPIDLVQWYAGDVAEVCAYANDGGTLAARQGPNNFVLNLKFTGGAIGRIAALFGVIHPPENPAPFSLFCTRGTVVDSRVTLDCPPDSCEEQALDLDEFNTGGPGHAGEIGRCMRHFEDCILTDRDVLVDAVQAAKTTAVSWAARRSLETGRPEQPAAIVPPVKASC